jgi:chromate reductase, NAD(P)H dehydrogenase (quinone)
MVKIIGISGSLRKGSYNTALLRAAKAYLPSNFELELASIAEIPLYNADDEDQNGLPEAVTQLKNKISASDALLIATPEYNHGIPGVLKNAIDWLTRPPSDVPMIFGNRKLGLVGASPSRLGTAFSQTAWLPIFRYLNVHPFFGKQLFVATANQHFNEKNELVNDDTKKALRIFIEGFCDFIKN